MVIADADRLLPLLFPREYKDYDRRLQRDSDACLAQGPSSVLKDMLLSGGKRKSLCAWLAVGPGTLRKNDLSMEVLRDFCTRETFLQSVPAMLGGLLIAHMYK
jgi:hypothetical protein